MVHLQQIAGGLGASPVSRTLTAMLSGYAYRWPLVCSDAEKLQSSSERCMILYAKRRRSLVADYSLDGYWP